MGKNKQIRANPGTRYFFAEWRCHREMTQQQLAAATGLATSSISQIETGDQGFRQASLERLAAALECSPGALLMVNPLDTRSPWALWEHIPPEKRETVLQVMESMARGHNRAA